VQSDRFGTSVADSLRVHSDNLRINAGCVQRALPSTAEASIPGDFLDFSIIITGAVRPGDYHIFRILLPTLGHRISRLGLSRF